MPRSKLRPAVRAFMLAGLVGVAAGGCVVVPARGRIVGPPVPVLFPPVVVAPAPVPVPPRRAYGHERYRYDGYGYGYGRYGYRRW